LGNTLAALASRAATDVWNAEKFWDNEEIATDFANMRATGAGPLASGGAAVGNAIGKYAGVAGIADSWSCRDEAGHQLGWSERAWAGVSGAAQLAGTATGLKVAGTAVFKAGLPGLASLFGRPAPSSGFQGPAKPWTSGATPNSVYTHIDPKTGKAVQNAIYDANGNVLGHVDFKNHGPGAPSGHGHMFPKPGNPASGHGPSMPHIPNNELPSGWDALPHGIEPRTPLGG
jgi:hypothetical protein